MEEANSRRSSRVATPTGSNCFPDSILDIEEKVKVIKMFTSLMIAMSTTMIFIIFTLVTIVMFTSVKIAMFTIKCDHQALMLTFTQVAYMSDVVDRAASATPTDRVSLSRWDLGFHHQQPTSIENDFCSH